ncbi:PREDICTED: uncharacterized protein LOC106742556 [Dinoponera quadriceps]|uniref:Uncharacterized protein LOC106742556 n=1 Tax=Dinoponera quadriceps TaxID=609295 RepID=A0A6P3WYB7_DINQU|nr:PREDICTED: uncharacterized protein LOC106742556 [Dinoponera quadriceps]XP_014471113.1 PREDICTED: uncharacterized protein LOC106742556 [Dinoponera quadriceps]
MSDGVQYRPMKYPYTIVAKVAQFPYKYYWKHSWLFKYLIYSTVLSAPIFYKIQKISYSPANVEKWDKIHKEMFEGTGDHH